MAEIDSWPLEYDEDRFAFYADLHDHPDTSIRQMAHVELDSAPYALLRNLDLRLDPKSIVRSLRVFSAYKWLPFNYLLLGISGDDVARKELNRAVTAADKYTGAASLGAAATALIEIDGLDGLARLEELFLDDPGEPLDRLEKVVQAMVIHNQVGTPELRVRIGDALSRLVRSRPETGAIVAQSLADSNDWSQIGAMVHLLESRRLRDPADIVTVATYLSQARKARAIE